MGKLLLANSIKATVSLVAHRWYVASINLARAAPLGVNGKPDIPYFTPSARDAISAVPLIAGTVQALHTVCRTWLRGGISSSHFKQNYWYGMPRFCALVVLAVLYHCKSKLCISRSCLILVLTTVWVIHVALMSKNMLKSIRSQLLHKKRRF